MRNMRTMRRSNAGEHNVFNEKNAEWKDTR